MASRRCWKKFSGWFNGCSATSHYFYNSVNYLAHLYFSDSEPLAWSGSLMGDFVKGAIPSDWPQVLIRHLRLHRRIDSYTQTSPAFQASRKRLDPRFRYARSVLVDVFYDHFLAQQWERYSPLSLLDFSRQVYSGLEQCFDFLPIPLQLQLPRMIEHNWLHSYRCPEIVERVLSRLEERLKHRFPLAEGYRELERWREPLEEDFCRFMEELDPLLAKWKVEF